VELADAHAHLFEAGFIGRYGRPCSGGDDLECYRAFRIEHSVGAALVVGYEGDTRYAQNSQFIAELAKENSWLTPLAFIRPDSPAIPPDQFDGISVFVVTAEEANQFASWPDAVFDSLGETEAIISINASPRALGHLRVPLARMERCQVLISHLGDPGAQDVKPSASEARSVLAPLLELADLPHIGVKLSGLYEISRPRHAYPHLAARPFVELLVDHYGPRRLFWGSDFSPALDFVSFEQTIDAVANLPWTQSEREAVMGGNLRRVLQRSRSASN
jgi:L-fuconolactonase